MTSSFVPADTDPDAFRCQVEHWRSMEPYERALIASRLTIAAGRMAEAGIRLDRPDTTAEEMRDELFRRRYGRAFADIVRKLEADE